MAIEATSKAAQEVLQKIRELQNTPKPEFNNRTDITQDSHSKRGFIDYLKDNIQQVNSMQKTADHMSMEVASGKSDAIHETMLATTQAELSFNLMVQIRNRALEAYQDVMKMPV